MKVLLSKINKIICVSIIVTAVVIGGLLIYFTLSKNKQDSTITLQNNNINAAIDLSSWQTYRNEELKIQFKYPSSWDLLVDPEKLSGGIIQTDEEGHSISLTDRNNLGYTLYISISKNLKHLSAKEFADEVVQNFSKRPYESDGEIIIGPYKAYARHNIFGVDAYGEAIYIATDEYLYAFLYPSPENNPHIPQSEENAKIVEKILSTFTAI